MERSRVITLRALVLGAVLVALAGAITPYSDFYIQQTYFAGNHLPIGSVFVLMLLVGLANPLIRRVRPGAELSPGELVTVWLMMVVTSGVPSSGLCRYLFSCLTTPYYFATTENNWAAAFHRFIDPRMVPGTDGESDVITYFYEGLPMPPGEELHGLARWAYTARRLPWAVWVRPLAVWSVMVLTLYFVMACLVSLLRKQWVERERLQFPLMRLPLQMVEAPEPGRLYPGFFRNRIMWIGFGVAGFAILTQSLNLYTNGAFPKIPQLIISISKITATVEPWKHMQIHYLQIIFSVIGVCYLLTTEVSLSLWVFFLLFRASFMVGQAMGYAPVLFPAWGRYQQAGGHLVWVAFMLWVARRHLVSVVRGALRPSQADDKAEALSYRLSLFGLIGGLLALAGWSTLMGAQFHAALAFYLLICVTLIVLTRIVAEGGLLFVQQSYQPVATLTAMLGPGFVNAASLVHLTIVQRILAYDMRESMMPSLANALKLTDSTGGSRRKLFGYFAVAVVIALLVSYATMLMCAYSYGARFLALDEPTQMYDDLAMSLQRGAEHSWKGPVNIAVGAAIMALLLFMRIRFIWWPLHPIGFVMAATYPMHAIWSSVMIGWLCKYLILKIGGVQTYRKLLPFFLGLILGELFMGGMFILLGLLTGRAGYRVLPG